MSERSERLEGNSRDVPAEGAERLVSASGDEEPPPAGGVFRRFAAGSGGFGNAMGAIEEIFSPARHEARIELEEQKRVGRPAPAPGDPPDLAEPEAASKARPGQRFKGKVKIPRPPA